MSREAQTFQEGAKGSLHSFGHRRLVFSTGTGFLWCMIVGGCKIVSILGSLETWSGNGQLIQHLFLVEGSGDSKPSTGVSTYLLCHLISRTKHFSYKAN